MLDGGDLAAARAKRPSGTAHARLPDAMKGSGRTAKRPETDLAE